MNHIEVLKQALEALESMANEGWLLHGPEGMDVAQTKCVKATTSLRQAIAEFDSHTLYREGYVNGYAFGEAAGKRLIAELESQEPVAWIAPRYEGGHENLEVVDEREFGAFRVYTHPPQRTWVGLTDEEITALKHNGERYISSQDFARAVEAKLKQKNGFAEEKNT